MNEKSKQVARTWILAGFVLVAVGATVDLLVLTSNGYFDSSNFRANLQVFSLPLASLAACWAWWLLSKIAAEKSDQRPLFQRAFLGLMLQSLCLCITYVNLLWTDPNFDRFTSSLWIQVAGLGATAIGFFLMAREFSSKKMANEAVSP